MPAINLDPTRTLIGYIVRHGELNIENRWDGWGKYVLSSEGKESAEKAGQWLSFEHIGRIVTSDLPRALQTAEIVMGCCECACPFMATDPNLRAWASGSFTGRKKTDEAKEEFKKFRDNPDLVHDGGESWNQMAERVKVALQYLCTPYKGLPTVVVTHNSVIKGLLDLDEKGDVIDPGGIIGVYLTQEGKCEFDVVMGATKLDVGSGMTIDSSCG